MTADSDALLDELRASPSDYVKVAIVDIDGMLRGKYLDKSQVPRRGVGRAASASATSCSVGTRPTSATTTAPTRVGTAGYPDGAVRIDLATHRQIPWEDGRDFFLGDFVGSGADYDVCPRLVLKQVVERAASLGYAGMFGHGVRVVQLPRDVAVGHDKGFRDLEPLTPGMFGYSILRAGPEPAVLRGAARRAAGLRCPTRRPAHRDRARRARSGHPLLRRRSRPPIAPYFSSPGPRRSAPASASCRASWPGGTPTLPGCSGHTHQSLWDVDGERNLFADGDDPDDEPAVPVLRRRHPRALLPDCLPVLRPHGQQLQAPGRWLLGADQADVGCRQPHRRRARSLAGSPKSTRLELRVPGSDVNPYLVGRVRPRGRALYGIERGLELRRRHRSAAATSTNRSNACPAT